MAVHSTARNRTAENQRELDLVTKAQAGDVSAGVELWLIYKDKLLPRVRRWNRINEWEKLFVDAGASQIYEKLPEFRFTGKPFQAWAYTVAHNAVRRLIRDLGIVHINIPLTDVEDELPDPLGPRAVYIKNRVRRAAYRLKGQQGAAVRGCFYEDKSDEEIAADEHIARRKVNYRKHQGFRSMRKELSDIPFKSIRPETRFSGF
jgi:DNA-directed RNA polymerase specialized sigma24 family protein